MKLNLYIDKKLTCALLINDDVEKGPGRLIDHWELSNNTKPNCTHMNNQAPSLLNSYKYHRVRMLFTCNEERVNHDFFCVNDIIWVNNLMLDWDLLANKANYPCP